MLLVGSAMLSVAAAFAGAAGLTATSNLFLLLAGLCFALGLTGVAGMLVFDIALARTQATVPSILRDLIQGIAFFMVAFTVLRQSGVDLLSLLTTSAVLTAVVGLALQNTIANVFAGVALQLDRTLGVGDWIDVGGRVGRIAEINWRSTSIRTKDGDTVIIPNGQLLSQEVTGLCKPGGARRMWLRAPFHYRHPPNQVRQTALEVVRDVPGVLDKPAPSCFPVEFGESAIVYALRYWIADVAEDSAIDGELRARFWYAAQRAGLEMPYPVRTLLISAPSEAAASDAREHGERLAALACIDVLSPLDAADRQSLAGDMCKVQFARGEQIIRQGDPGDSLYFIQSGEVEISMTMDGARREVATLGPGKVFGEMSLVTGEPRRTTCTAKSDVVCYVVDHGAFQSILDARPKIAEDVSALLASRQLVLDGTREELSAEVRARRQEEARLSLLGRIRGFFRLD